MNSKEKIAIDNPENHVRKNKLEAGQRFEIQSDFEPSGDQPSAIKELVKNENPEIVIYLDNSFSMQARGTKGPLLNQAVQSLLSERIPLENITVFTNTKTYPNRNIKDLKSEKNFNFSEKLSRLFSRRSTDNSSKENDEIQENKISTESHGMFNLRRLCVEDVAIPKAEIVSVSADIKKSELVSVFRESGLTRLPVFEGTLDNPIGMVHLKDFTLRYAFASKNTFKIKDILRPLLYVPASMTIGVLLTKMQSARRHLALVIDEYGGVDGLVTIEDLIEQVIGEIEDEHDIDEGQMWAWESDNTIVALARASLDELGPELGIDFTQGPDIDAEEVDSLGGLVFVLAGRVPVRGEVVQHPQGLEFEIIDADPRRIKRVRLRLKALVKAAE